MSIMVSSKNIYVQFIDDDKSTTVASVSTLVTEKKNNVEAATSLGKRAADEAGKAGIKQVVVDRGGHKFHGKLKAVVDEVIKAGLLSAGRSAENKEDK